MLRVLENKVRRFIGVDQRPTGFFVMFGVPPYTHSGPAALHEYTIPAAKIPGDFMVACWKDIGSAVEEKALYEALQYYMCEHSIVESTVILKTQSWAGRFTIDSGVSTTLMIMEALP
jgi:hypothetical protein